MYCRGVLGSFCHFQRRTVSRALDETEANESKLRLDVARATETLSSLMTGGKEGAST